MCFYLDGQFSRRTSRPLLLPTFSRRLRFNRPRSTRDNRIGGRISMFSDTCRDCGIRRTDTDVLCRNSLINLIDSLRNICDGDFIRA